MSQFVGFFPGNPSKLIGFALLLGLFQFLCEFFFLCFLDDLFLLLHGDFGLMVGFPFFALLFFGVMLGLGLCSTLSS